MLVALGLSVIEPLKLPECEPEAKADTVELPTRVTVRVPLIRTDGELAESGAVAVAVVKEIPMLVDDCATTSDAKSAVSDSEASMARACERKRREGDGGLRGQE